MRVSGKVRYGMRWRIRPDAVCTCMCTTWSIWTDDGRALDDFDLRPMGAGREDLDRGSRASVDGRRVRDKLVGGVH